MKSTSIRPPLRRGLLLISLCASMAFAEPGELDFTFGTLGVASTVVGTNGSPGALAVQADGKIVLAGFARFGFAFQIVLARFNVDGTLDAAFGEDGIVTTAVGTVQDLANAVAVQPDGKIVVAGTSIVTAFEALVLRYDSDGTLDPSFGDGGKVVTVHSAPIVAFGLALQPDGKIVIAGGADNAGDQDFGIVRYLSDGSLDSTFGTGGIVVAAIGSGNDFGADVALQTDGKIVVAGEIAVSGHSAFGVARFNSDGSLDTSFGTGGKVISDFGDGGSVESVKVQTDGKILLAGSVRVDSQGRFAVARYQANGTLDPTFGAAGLATATVGTRGSAIFEMELQADGKVLAAGDATGATDSDFALVRFNADGSLDPQFGLGGVVLTEIGAPSDRENVRAMAVQTDGKIVLGGVTATSIVVARYFGGNRPAPLDEPVFDTKDGVPGEPDGTMFLSFGAPAVDGGKLGGLAKIGRRGVRPQQVILGGDGVGGVLARSGGDDPVGAEFIAFGDPVFAGEALGFAAVARQPVVNAQAERVLTVRPGGKLAALYSRLTNAAGLRRLAAQADPAPGTSAGQFARFSGFGLPRDRGGLVFAAKLHREGDVTRGNDFGVWREKLTGGDSDLLLRHGDPVGTSARTIEKIELLTPVANATDQRRSFAPDGGVAAAASFADGTSGVVRVAADGSTDVPVDTMSFVPDAAGDPVAGVEFEEFEAPALTSGGRVAFLATLRAIAGGAPRDSAIFSRTDDSFRRLLGRGDAVPGRGTDRFAQLGQPLMGQSGLIGLTAALTGRAPMRKAIVMFDGNVRVVVARLGERALGVAPGAVYRRFISVVVTDSDPGRLLFTATIGGRRVNASNNVGLWSVSSASGTNIILRKGQPIVIGGQTFTVRSFEALQAPRTSIGQGRGTDASGFVTAKAKLSDGRSGVLRIPLP